MVRALIEDARYARRSLRHAPALSLTIVVVLALTIGAVTTLHSLLNAIVFRQLPVRDPGRLVSLSTLSKSGELRPIYQSTVTQLAADQTVLESLAMYSGGGAFPLEANGQLMQRGVEGVSPEYFTTLGLRPHQGTFFTSDDVASGGPVLQVVVLSYRFWQQDYGSDPNVIGRTLRFDGTPLRIIGIMPPTFNGLQVDGGIDCVVPISVLIRLPEDPKRPLRSRNVLGRMRDGQSLDRVRAELDRLWPATVAATIPPGVSATEQTDLRASRLTIEPIAGGFSGMRRRYGTQLALLTGFAGLMLLMGCVNASGLLLGRGISRNREFRIQLALGATSTRLLRRLLLETLFLSVFGVAAALMLAWWFSGALATLLWAGSRPLAMSATPDAKVFGVAAIVGVLATLIVGGIPGVLASRQDAPRSRATEGHGRRWGRALLIAQTALSFVLLFGAGLFAKSLWNLSSLDTGFHADHVIWARVSRQPDSYRNLRDEIYYRELVEKIAAVPGVQSVALSHFFPAYLNFASFSLTAASRRDSTSQSPTTQVALDYVTPGFFQTGGIPVVAGRDFTWEDGEKASAVTVINEKLSAELFGAANPIGQRIRLKNDRLERDVEIVGVVRNSIVGNIRAPDLPVAFRPKMQEPLYRRLPVILVKTGYDSTGLQSSIGEAVGSLRHEYVRQFLTLDEQIAEATFQERLLAGLSSFFAGLAIVLTFVGVFAVFMQTVRRRVHEIGVRLALGASRGRVLRTLVTEGVAIAVVGVALGAPFALMAARVTETQLFRLASWDPPTFVVAGVLLLVLGALGTLVPARAAARVEPSVALRTE